MKELDYLLKDLEGTEKEKEYLERRFTEMSVKEQYTFEGAIQILPIETATDLLNLSEQLSKFNFYYKAIDDRSLGEYIARYKEGATDEILPFIKTEQLGKEYHEDFQGIFTDKGYILQRNSLKQIYDGTTLFYHIIHHISKIFEDNIPLKSSGVELRIDSKLMRKLR